MMTFQHKFFENIPEKLEKGVLYVSIPFTTTIHLCPCGCGSEIVVKISPIDWKITFDGESISIYPSIGNWGLDCRSHYWIRNNKVIWAESWSRKRVINSRKKHDEVKKKYRAKKKAKSSKG